MRVHQVFVELYNYRPEWRSLDADHRRAFISAVATAVTGLQQRGVEVIGYGANDPGTDRRAPYDFFSVYRVPDTVTQREFEAGIVASGWYQYFEQVNVSGAALSPIGGLLNNAALLPPATQGPPISPVSPFTKQKTDVLGRTMAFVDEGSGLPVVFVHGDVMSSFLWRNVIPHLSGKARSIAVDLIGAGDSDKLPGAGPGTYTFGTHARYFDAWMQALSLPGQIVLVGQDWGANLAFDWAMRHEHRVRGLAFSEAITPPFEWEDWPASMHAQFRYLRTAEAERDVLENNFFVNASRHSITRMLTPAEWAEIVRPYAEPGRGTPPDDRLAARGAIRRRPRRDARRTRGPGRVDGHNGYPQASPAGRPRRDRPDGRPQAESHPHVAGHHGGRGPRSSLDPKDAPHAMGAALADWVGSLGARG